MDNEAPRSSSPTAPPRGKAPISVFVTLCSIFSGLVLADLISDQVLPLTLHRFTENASTIGLILAIHPAFGFIAQPLVGVLSDRIWTRLGRRGFFLVTCSPVVGASLAFMPQTQALWQLVVLVVIFQFYLALLWGSDHPLLADLVPAPQRTLVKACMMTSAQVLTFVFLHYGIGYALGRFGESFLYYVGAGGQLLLIGFAALFLGEKPLPPVARPKLTLRRYVTDMLGDPVLRRFGLLAFTQAACFFSVSGFIALFAVNTLGLSKAAFGQNWSAQSLLALGCTLPLGWLVERLPKQWALVAGYLIALAACAWGLLARDEGDLFVIALLFGFGSVIVDVTQKPFFTEYLPSDIVGQLSGAYNICRALGRSAALAGGGWLIGRFGNDYRLIWPFALGFCVLSALIAATLPDARYARRKAAHQ